MVIIAVKLVTSFCLLWLPCLLQVVASGKASRVNKYATNCVLHTESSSAVEGTRYPSIIALYSVWHTFSLQSAPVAILDSSLCSPLSRSHEWHATQPVVAVVSRGECTFDEKTRHATEAGYSALIIVNTEEETFLFGDAHSDQADGIPTLMVGSSFWTHGDTNLRAKCREDAECPQLFVDISYGKETLNKDSFLSLEFDYYCFNFNASESGKTSQPPY